MIVPIQLWREIESERETAYLLHSEPMKQRQGELPIEAVSSFLGVR